VDEPPLDSEDDEDDEAAEDLLVLSLAAAPSFFEGLPRESVR
jgi:hypothetical protein